MTIESPKQKRGGANQKNKSAAARAARKWIQAGEQKPAGASWRT